MSAVRPLAAASRATALVAAAFLAAVPTVRAQSSEDATPSYDADAATPGANGVALVCFRDTGTGGVFTLHQVGDQLRFRIRNAVSPGSREFAGPVIATIDAFASVWSDFEPDIRAIETMIDAGSSTWTPFDGDRFDGDRDALARSALRDALARSALSDVSEGFVMVMGRTGLVSESAYLFRIDGWEYAVLSSHGRPWNVPADEMHEYRSNRVVAVSPRGQRYRYEGVPLAEPNQEAAAVCTP